MKRFPHYTQAERKDCGPTCLKIIGKHYGKTIQIEKLRELAKTNRGDGSLLFGLSDAAEKIGFKSTVYQLDFNTLLDAPFPFIVHWDKKHYVVVYDIKKKRNGYKIYISDPAIGKYTVTEKEFINHWIDRHADENTEDGILLLIEPSEEFYKMNSEYEKRSKSDFSFVTRYFFRYKKYLFQLLLGLMVASILQIILPFLTQSIVDIGIQNQDISFVYLMLMAQLAIFLGRSSIEIIRSWLLLNIGSRINISMISDFIYKLMKLPISYFQKAAIGDMIMKINDHERIKKLITTSFLDVILSIFNLLIFGFILAFFNWKIFTIFLIGSIFYFLWITFFLKRRKKLDYLLFAQRSSEQDKVHELLYGMQEIKLHNAETKMRWKWEFQQAILYKTAMKSLVLEQTQSTGSSFINELKNLLITVVSAALVIEGELTLGTMLAIASIVGQLNVPVLNLINFIKDAQDAKIAMERLLEIHNTPNETPDNMERNLELPEKTDITLNNITFQYPNSYDPVIENLNLNIPANKITAIVGTSGSGKTTLLKLLLSFYKVNKGKIKVGDIDLENIDPKVWRENCGVVMQEGFVFDESIAKNIAIGENYIDKKRLIEAVTVANIREYIESLPLNYNTTLGREGGSLSTGQKQRLLIARAVYKNPKILFFDEATSALDANNERIIMDNLNRFFTNKTVIVIAHRLSTVKNADQIVVLEKGKIVEVGTHDELVYAEGNYYHLVKNQLELGS
ncbi:peptidase domain-containing ABC transporter [Aureivirga sp. CE67]|uniref:peptidase domain-containing ABC transporter n=1 Tax=Aureivirga sp. CE67 TaxID=1788983 RepID=UPI0018CB829D|nr:peptidase domain-containing ABC transporter [Aureivirga sp. CE67]